MSDRPDWMTKTDKDILKLLEHSKVLKLRGLWLKPATIAVNIDRHNNYVTTRLGVLLDRGLVEKDDKSFYRITDKGSAWVNGLLDAHDL